ncbi:MAG TPA: hypothetical protein VGL34_17345 [Steroidobacteraceae bacterium]
MTRTAKSTMLFDLNQQGAIALLAATFEFLRRNNISGKSIVEFTRNYHVSNQRRRSLRLYRKLVRTYDDMGVIMATWFSNPKFLNAAGYPLPLSQGTGSHSIAQLIRVSGARIERSVAMELMRQSPSIKFSSDGTLSALRRVFVFPKFEVPRAAFVVERYLDTLQQNASARKKGTTLLLERSCHVPEVDLATIAPILRDIDSRGTAFMDSIDGDIEGRRLRQSKRKRVGEVGVIVFAWTTPTSTSKPEKRSRPLNARYKP